MIAMLKNLKIQSKLLLMPLVASIAFLLVLGMDLILEQQNNRLLLRLEQEYYPHHEIAQKLAESLIALQRNLQDAVASSDTDLLVETEHPYRVILAQLDHARRLGSADGNQLAALEPEIAQYYRSVRSNSERMIAGESGDKLMDDIANMVRQHNSLKTQFEAATKQAKTNITQAFAQQRKNHRKATVSTAVSTLLALSLLGWLSFIVTRLLTEPLKRVAAAVNSFAQNEEHAPLDINSSDEIGVLANAFKEMIAKIRIARTEREKAYQEAVEAKETVEQHAQQLSVVNSELDKHRHRLEELVEERTAELQTVNENLKGEITTRRRMESILKSYTKVLETRNRELQDFAYIASHDLQEPLRKILAFGDRLRSKFSETLDAHGLDYLNRMQNAAGRMQRLIEDLLLYSRVTTKAQPFTTVELTRIAHEVISDLEIRIAEVNGQVEVADLPVIEADPTQIRQLMQNLIGNGLKFHRDDMPPVIKVYSDFAASKNGHPGSPGQTRAFCKIVVEDNGIGFDKKYAERIFGVFQRLHGREKYEGSGIGLAVCRKIVERHGGEIVAIGTPGQGAKFEITLPMNQKGD